ncbi:hypothetical protein [Azospirillum doebereinerae]
MLDPSPTPSSATGRLFRKAALDRLSTTEDLDQPATLISPRGWWWRLGLAMLCLTGAVWILSRL